MSEIRLVIRDAARDICGTPHGGFADMVVAALSAEPETIEELDVAIERFHKLGRSRFFHCFDRGIDDRPHDAGVMIIDLAARLIAYDSTYSAPSREGHVNYQNGECSTRHGLRYHLPDDWKIVNDVEGWRPMARERRRERDANPPFDARAVLYGRPLVEFIAAECFNAPSPPPTKAEPVAPDSRTHEETGQSGDMAYDFPPRDEAEETIVRDIHIKWMMTTRDDLRGQTPREVMVARHDFIGWDMQDRSERWSQVGSPAPMLDPQSRAYLFAGFGTHEHVVYYEMVRFLLWECRGRLRDAAKLPRAACLTTGDFLASEVPALEKLRDEWLDSPDPEYHGLAPREVIDHERRRMPEGMSGREAVIDDDCPLCQMMADMPGPGFWGLDGCNMDDDFAFDFSHRTRDEYDQEQRRREEFNRKFKMEWDEKKRLGVENAPGGGYSSPDYVWERSFVSDDAPDFPAMRLFAIGSNLAELVVDLKQPTENRPLIDQLSRDFGNLREVSGSAQSAGALVEPVIDRFCETLDAVAAARTDLEAKCTDLQERLKRFLEPPREADPDADADMYFDGSDDVPF
jgi:hypothetical protein